MPGSRLPSRAAVPGSRLPSRAAVPRSRLPSRAAVPRSRLPSRAAVPRSRLPSRAAVPRSRLQRSLEPHQLGNAWPAQLWERSHGPIRGHILITDASTSPMATEFLAVT